MNGARAKGLQCEQCGKNKKVQLVLTTEGRRRLCQECRTVSRT